MKKFNRQSVILATLAVLALAFSATRPSSSQTIPPGYWLPRDVPSHMNIYERDGCVVEIGADVIGFIAIYNQRENSSAVCGTPQQLRVAFDEFERAECYSAEEFITPPPPVLRAPGN